MSSSEPTVETPTTLTKSFSKPMSALDARFEAQRIAFGPVVFQCVRIALAWGVLARVDADPGRTTGELAAALGRSDYAIAVLLETCLSAGVVRVDANGWWIEKTGQVLLRDELTRVNLEFVQEVCYAGLADLETALAEARPAGLRHLGDWETIYRGLRDLPDAAKKAWFDFDHLYSDSAFSMALPHVFAAKPRTLMDVGANTGKWARRCLDFDPDVRLNLVDLPEQLGVARANLHDHADRVAYHAVDMLDAGAAFPGGQAAIWMSQFLSCFGAETISGILRRAGASLAADGRLFILDTFWDRQRFDVAAYCIINTSPYFTAMANGTSKMYRAQEYIELAAGAGLRLVDVRDGLGLSHSLLTFVRA